MENKKKRDIRILYNMIITMLLSFICLVLWDLFVPRLREIAMASSVTIYDLMFFVLFELFSYLLVSSLVVSFISLLKDTPIKSFEEKGLITGFYYGYVLGFTVGILVGLYYGFIVGAVVGLSTVLIMGLSTGLPSEFALNKIGTENG